jgi:hypothetical protein
VSSATLAGKPPPSVKPVLGPYGSTGLDGLAGQSVQAFASPGGPAGFVGQNMQVSFGGPAGAGPGAADPDGVAGHSSPGAFGPIYTGDVTDRVRVTSARSSEMRPARRARLPFVAMAIVGLAGAVAGVWFAVGRDVGSTAPAKADPAEPRAAVPPPGEAPNPAAEPPADLGRVADPPAVDPGKADPSGTGGPGKAAEPPTMTAAPTAPADPGKAGEPPSIAADPTKPEGRAGEPATPVEPAAKVGESGAKAGDAPVKGDEPATPADKPPAGPSGDARPDPTKPTKDPHGKATKPKVRPDSKRGDRRSRKAEPKEQPWSVDSPFLPKH